MSNFSRRTLLRSSALAAFAWCVPEMWPLAGTPAGPAASPLPAAAKTGSGRMTIVEDFLDEVRQSHAYTLECAQSMPGDKYGFRPVPEVRSFGQQMVHIAEAMPGLFDLFIEGRGTPSHALSEAGKEQFSSKADVIARLEESFGYVGNAAQRLKDKALKARVQAFGREMTKRRMLRFLLDHTTHHRGQAIVYLRINGIRPPTYRA